jgi:hypothetical protein
MASSIQTPPFRVSPLNGDEWGSVRRFFGKNVDGGEAKFDQTGFFKQCLQFEKQAGWSKCYLFESEGQIVALSDMDPLDPTCRQLTVRHLFEKQERERLVETVWKWFLDICVPKLCEQTIPVFGLNGEIVSQKPMYSLILRAEVDEKRAALFLKSKGFKEDVPFRRKENSVWKIAICELMAIRGTLSQLCLPWKVDISEHDSEANFLTVAPIDPTQRKEVIEFLKSKAIENQIDEWIESTLTLLPLVDLTFSAVDPGGKVIALIHFQAKRNRRLSVAVRMNHKDNVANARLFEWAFRCFIPEMKERKERALFLNEDNMPIGCGLIEDMTVEVDPKSLDPEVRDFLLKTGFTQE